MLVALAVLTIAMAAVLRSMGQAIDLSTDLRARTVALWVAEERAVYHQVRNAWPDIETKDGTVEFGGQEWRYNERITSTQSSGMRRMDIEVRAPSSPDILARLSIFLAKKP